LKDKKAGLDEASDEEESDEDNPKACVEYVALNPFKDLYKHSPIIKMAFEFGPSCIPLSAMGMILNFAGNHLLHYCNQIFKRKIFYPMTKVTHCQLLPSGEVVTHAIEQNAK
jgi:hypothetical protein